MPPEVVVALTVPTLLVAVFTVIAPAAVMPSALPTIFAVPASVIAPPELR
jgi:hypothetical protein